MFRTVSNGRFAPVPDFQVSDTNLQTQTDIRFAALSGGGFVAVWYDFAAGQVRGQRFNDNGREIGSEFVVNQIQSGSQPSVAALTSGGFVVTWGEEIPFPGMPISRARFSTPMPHVSVWSSQLTPQRPDSRKLRS